jgi:DNA-binding MarR family transcriptional regulator
MALAEHSREDRLVTQQDLGCVLGIDKSNVARLCAKMERAGHVKQERSPDDGRARLISLTKAGGRVAEAVGRASQERFRRVLDAVQPEHRGYLLSALERLNGAVSSITELELEAHLAPRAIHRPVRRTSPRRRMRNQETS